MMIARPTLITFRPFKVRVRIARAEDIVVRKAIANRLRDAADIEGILAASDNFDRAYVLQIVCEFWAILDQPELVRDLERVFTKVP